MSKMSTRTPHNDAPPSRTLGVDPGFGRCGLAVVEKEGGRERVLFSMCIETEATSSFPERLVTIVETCSSIIEKHRPHAMALERLYFNSNQKTAMQVSEARGALIYCAARAGLSIHEYTPGQVKAATAGWGRSDKQAVERMVGLLTGISTKAMRDDEVDAIAVGLTHLAHTRMPR